MDNRRRRENFTGWSSPVISGFKAFCFELLLRAALVRSPIRKEFTIIVKDQCLASFVKHPCTYCFAIVILFKKTSVLPTLHLDDGCLVVVWIAKDSIDSWVLALERKKLEGRGILISHFCPDIEHITD